MSDSSAIGTAGQDESLVIAQLRADILQRNETIARQAAQIEHAQKIFREACKTARLGVWECSLEDEQLTWSDGVYDIFEMNPGTDLRRETILRFYTPEARREMERLRSEAVRTQTGFCYEAEICTMRGQRKWMRITAKVECADGRAVRIFGIKQDVTEERMLLDRTRYLAEYDTLTGLGNRGQFQARLSEIDMARTSSAPYSALVLIDIDHFKAINDTFGHSVGDQCLIETARRLKLTCGPAHHIARIGGDEFAILLQPDLTPSELDAIGARLLAALTETGPVPGTSVRLGTSIGIAEAGNLSSRQLFLNADTALYAAKDAGRGSVRRYLPDMGSRHDHRLSAATVETLRARARRANRSHADVA